MTTKTQNIGAIKNQLLKIAQDIQTPVEAAAVPEGSPEAVMELIDDAIQVLEVAEESIPAENPEEATKAPIIGAKNKSKSAQEDDDDDDEKKKEAKIRKAQDDEKKKDDETEKEKNARVRQAVEDDEDKEKKELNARIATLEGELADRKKTALATQLAELYPEELRETKFAQFKDDEEEDEKTLEAKIKAAKDVLESVKPSSQYKPAKNESGYLGIRKAKLENKTPAWRF